MVNELLSRNRLVGISSKEVESLLGKTDSSLEDVFFYEVDIGQKYLFSGWNYFLELSFEDEMVSHVKLSD